MVSRSASPYNENVPVRDYEINDHTSRIFKNYITVIKLKGMLYAVRCLKTNEDMILTLAGQFKQLSHEPEKFR